jgi:transporter family protein
VPRRHVGHDPATDSAVELAGADRGIAPNGSLIPAHRMIWFWLTILSSLLWSVNNHLDKFLAERYYRGGELPGTLMFLTATLGAAFSLIIVIANPSARSVPAGSIAVLLLAGMLDFVYLFPYTMALLRDEASRVAPLFQLYPVFTYVLATVFLGEQITARQLVAGLVITVGAVGINLDVDDRLRPRGSVLLLMLVATALFATETFLFKLGARTVGFWPGAAYQYLGAAIGGLMLAAVSRRYRQDFAAIFRIHRRTVLTLSVMADVISTTARVTLNYATLLAPLALVTFVSNSQPFFIIALGVGLTVLTPGVSREEIATRHLTQKLLCSAVIAGGTYVLVAG